jgi:hypothetical protein
VAQSLFAGLPPKVLTYIHYGTPFAKRRALRETTSDDVQRSSPLVPTFTRYSTPSLPKVGTISQAKVSERIGDGGSVTRISRSDDCTTEMMSCRWAGGPDALLPAQFGSQALAAKSRKRDPDCHFGGSLQFGFD